MRSVVISLMLFGCLCLPQAARADEYAKPSWPSMVRVLARFNAFDFSDEKLLEEYAIVTECEMYEQFYRDDFRWHKVLQAVKTSIGQFSMTYPTSYAYDVELQLGRYDFKNKLFRFTEKSKIYNVNSFVLFQASAKACVGGRHIAFIPSVFRAVLDAAVYIPGLPLSQKDSEMLLELMDRDNNPSRIVKARFNLRVIYVEKFHRTSDGDQGYYYTQKDKHEGPSARLEAHLDSVEFFEDAAMRKLIYTYRP
ncbi:MAG: DUF4852 domain-containing protein [Bdellovibrionales bacterium]